MPSIEAPAESDLARARVGSLRLLRFAAVTANIRAPIVIPSLSRDPPSNLHTKARRNTKSAMRGSGSFAASLSSFVIFV
jgi:hypothetical protein